MARTKTLVNYLQSRGISLDIATSAQQVFDEWRKREIPLWKQDNKRDNQRAALIIGQAMSGSDPVRFFAPVCPDYPADSRVAQLGIGLGETVPPILSFMKSLTALMDEYKVPYNFTVLLADTETDLPEVVTLLANSVDDFLDRCRKSVTAAQSAAPDLICKSNVQIVPFSEYFHGKWHAMQYFWEGIVERKLEEDRRFNFFISQLAGVRREKYEKQLGRSCSNQDCLRMAIRHYAQYHTLGYWMRQYDGSIIINTDSPNLRAIRRPFVVEKGAYFVLPKVKDQQIAVPIVVL